MLAGSSDDVELPPNKIKLEMSEPEEVTTVMHGKVCVTPQEYVQVINRASTHYIVARKSRNRQRKSTVNKKTAFQKAVAKKNIFAVETETDSSQKATETTLFSLSRKRKLPVKTVMQTMDH